MAGRWRGEGLRGRKGWRVGIWRQQPSKWPVECLRWIVTGAADAGQCRPALLRAAAWLLQSEGATLWVLRPSFRYVYQCTAAPFSIAGGGERRGANQRHG